MKNIRLRIALIPVAALLLTSCGTMSTKEPHMVTQAEKAQLAERGKSPQVFGLTAYSTPNGAIFAGGFRLHHGQARRIDFASDKNSTTPLVKAEGGLQFLIDSSATESWITTEAFSKLNGVTLKESGLYEKRPQHVYDETGGLAVVIPKIIIDELHIESSVFFMRNKHGPLGVLTRWEDPSEIDGVVGADFLRAFKFVRISFKNRYVVMSATTEYPDTNNRIATIPLIKSNEGLTLEAVINGDREVVFVDIAGDFEMATDTTASETLRQVSIGDAVYRKVEAIPGREIGLGLEPQPRIGRQLLEKYDLVFNNYCEELILERPSE